MSVPKIERRTLQGINVVLLLAIIILVNLVGSNSFFKIDLTRGDAYSLSRVSRETLARIEDPLRIKVYYTEDVPAPYNSVRQYLVDTLKEFDKAEDEFFSFELIDPGTPEGRQEAQSNGLVQAEIQEIQSDEFQSRSVFLGAIVQYGNVTEKVDQIVSTEGLEYRLTTAMMSAINQVDVLSGTTEDVVMMVMASPSFSDIGIRGFESFIPDMERIYQRINRDNFGRIRYELLQPSSDAEIENLKARYNVRPIKWENRMRQQNQGLLEVVLRYGDTVERVPVEIFRGLLGGFSLAPPEEIEGTLREALRSLVNANPKVAYETSGGEMELNDFQTGAGAYSMLLGERYELVPVTLSENDIPAGIDTLIVNGPREPFTEEALYRIDQFVLGGGSLLVFLDSHFQFVPPQQQMMQQSQPIWLKNETGLEKLLERWGLRLTGTIVLDEESFVMRQGGRSQQIFQAPVLSGDGISRESVITAGLQDIIFIDASEILPVPETESAEGSESPEKPVYTSLLRTSENSWTIENIEDLGPWIQGAPRDADLGPRDVAVLVEGEFTSYFAEPVDLGIPFLEEGDQGEGGESMLPEETAEGPGIIAGRHLSGSVEPGKVLLVSTSAVTTPQLLNPQARTPNGTFLLNAVDYLNGAAGMAELRSKGLGVPRIEATTPGARLTARWGNTILVPLIVVILGLIMWNVRRSRSRRIQMMFEDKGKES